jgi:hypothetical protein
MHASEGIPSAKIMESVQKRETGGQRMRQTALPFDIKNNLLLSRRNGKDRI